MKLHADTPKYRQSASLSFSLWSALAVLLPSLLAAQIKGWNKTETWNKIACSNLDQTAAVGWKKALLQNFSIVEPLKVELLLAS